MAFYGGESARDLGMPDSATTFYRLLADKVKPSFEPFARPMMIHDFILVAIARHRLGEMEAYQQLVDTARIQLAGDPALYFYLACIYANTDQPEAAIDAMRQAAEQGWQQDMLWWVWNTICDPMLDPIRETDAFKALVRHHFPKYYDVATRVAGRP